MQDILALLTPADRLEISSGLGFALLLARYAHKAKAKLVIDAEEYKYQAGVHLFAVMLSEHVTAQLATTEPLVYNTHQMYLRDSMPVLDMHIRNQYKLGVKLVRGAYLDSEDPDVLCESYEKTNEQYNAAIKLCSDRNIHTIVATHNHDSIKIATSLENPRISYAQLLGMADDISHYLAHHGQQVYKYIPYGSVQDVVPYLVRRAHENKAMTKRAKAERKRYLDEFIRRVKGQVCPTRIDFPVRGNGV
ncbi:Proline dehydrogenase 1, mitochondrial [Neolecta irregularis DAH-3]|uniref:Proline dehydrogenase n=1 Tax=Neolecta irregularis (strain DAH-3) TaxID=1198029 RepID=A0A1U7LPZ4_NEOID|nr:Proline dehydrogenase 1, mitochondrial [Neolecta irregularis DAH-3]|eukprot:OLL24591.1 Proline dehydrogenase 1, mitochondrial [Neolecta irregularis DAH-3]